LRDIVAVRLQVVVRGRLIVVDGCSIHANAEKKEGEEKEVRYGSIDEGSWEMKRTNDPIGAL
jgi:hypothetical protein